MNTSLYALTSEYRSLLDKLSDGDFDAQTIADTVEASGLSDDIAVKAQGIEIVARSMEMHTPAIDFEIARLQELKSRRCKNAAGLREYLKNNMQACGFEKIETPLFKLSIQSNPPAVDIYEPGLIESKWMTEPQPPPPAPNKTAIKAALKAGIEVQGARLTAGTRLVVK